MTNIVILYTYIILVYSILSVSSYKNIYYQCSISKTNKISQFQYFSENSKKEYTLRSSTIPTTTSTTTSTTSTTTTTNTNNGLTSPSPSIRNNRKRDFSPNVIKDQPLINEFIRNIDRVRVIASTLTLNNETNDEDEDEEVEEEEVDEEVDEEEDEQTSENTLTGIVNDNGDIMLGILSFNDALLEAKKRNLDLVLINEKSDPPVCRIIDYGKYKYSLEKRKKENLKKQIKSEIKEIKMSHRIDQHDFDVRLRSVMKFLSDGDRVKILVQFKGREMQHKQLGRDLLKKILLLVDNTCIVESQPKDEGRAISMLLGPKKP